MLEYRQDYLHFTLRVVGDGGGGGKIAENINESY